MLDIDNKVINILGNNWKVVLKDSDSDENLIGSDGYTEPSVKEIVLRRNNENGLKNFKNVQAKQLRHEIIHAFLYESGLSSNWQHYSNWGHDETFIDWFAIMYPKINKVYKELGCSD